MADLDDASCHDLNSVRTFLPQDREGDRAYVSVVDLKPLMLRFTHGVAYRNDLYSC